MLPGKKYKPIDFAWMAWRRRWFIVGGLAVGLYAALIVSSRLPTLYRSEMLIQVVPQRVPDSYVRSTVTIKTEDRLNALSQQVMSRTQLERLIQEMNLYPDERTRMPMQDIVERMRANIERETARSSANSRDADAFYVRFTYPDRELATRVTERLGVLYIDVNARDRGDLAQATNNFLQAQLVEARQKLEQQERRLEGFRERNAGRLPTQLQFNMQAIQNTQLQLQSLVESLARDRDRKLMLERLLSSAESELVIAVQPPAAAPPAQNADPAAPAGAGAAQQLASARDTLARLELRLTPEHPDIARTKRLIRDLEKRVADEAAAANAAQTVARTMTPEEASRRERLQQSRAEIESLERQIKFKESEEQRLRGVIADYQRRIEQVPGVESEWIALTRDYDTQQAAYKDLLTKSEQSAVAAELEKRQIGEQFRVLDPARAPIRPTGIARLQVNVMGAGAGFGIGLLIAALFELLDRTYRTAGDVLDVLKLPVVATVPYISTADDRQRARRHYLLAATSVAVVTLVAGYGFWTMQLWKFIK